MKNMLYTMYASASDAFDFLKETQKRAGIFDRLATQLYSAVALGVLIAAIGIIIALMMRGFWKLGYERNKKGWGYLLVSFLLCIVLLFCIYMVLCTIYIQK